MSLIRRHGPDAADHAATIESALLADLRTTLPQGPNTGLPLNSGPEAALDGGPSASTAYRWLRIKTPWVDPARRPKVTAAGSCTRRWPEPYR